MQYIYFLSVSENNARGLNINRACKGGAMTEGNISRTDRQKNSYYSIYCSDILKTKKLNRRVLTRYE